MPSAPGKIFDSTANESMSPPAACHRRSNASIPARASAHAAGWNCPRCNARLVGPDIRKMGTRSHMRAPLRPPIQHASAIATAASPNHCTANHAVRITR